MNPKIVKMAIENLCPDAEYTYDDDNLDEIIWIKGTNPPSKTAIIAEMAKVEEAETQKATQAQIAKEALLEKLGITADEAKLLLS